MNILIKRYILRNCVVKHFKVYLNVSDQWNSKKSDRTTRRLPCSLCAIKQLLPHSPPSCLGHCCLQHSQICLICPTIVCKGSRTNHCAWRPPYGAAVVHRNKTKCVRLLNTASVFRAELYALLLAIEVVRCSKGKNFVIFSDSMSSLQAISGFKIELDLVQRIIKDYSTLSKSGKTIVLCWIPSHVGISGNEKADTAVKSALSLRVTPWKFQLLILFLVLLCGFQKSGSNFGTAAQETNYILSGQPSVATNQNHPCLVGMK